MQLLEETMQIVVNQASSGGADKKLATKEAIFDSFQTIYTLGQCLPDLSVRDCDRCLEIADNNLPSCCGWKRGGRVLMSSCNVRFELYPFYQSNQTKAPSPVPTSVTKSKVEISTVESLLFDLITIKSATNNFSDENKLGEGGFGAVYKVVVDFGKLNHSSNILLEEDLNPKISDFGMAKIFEVDQTQGNTSRVVGTFGYMSPQYAMHGQFSVKSDGYSFGVLILEIISGRKNSHFHESNYAEDLLSYAWKHWNEGTTLELLDFCIKGFIE
ncbi:cysteine-rich receptor-like protein kinase 10 [Quillaja saponaria]|uniref:Cysteine-rich receptor-like protein kinase 10 n=1 Tax=Quillaja saponaria TaxID=32244 RepID=A0AAD7KW65_QUISA|nr:cysteine-rich receptor-like protein kinase 10 [Quillaja saponaria]